MIIFFLQNMNEISSSRINLQNCVCVCVKFLISFILLFNIQFNMKRLLLKFKNKIVSMNCVLYDLVQFNLFLSVLTVSPIKNSMLNKNKNRFYLIYSFRCYLRFQFRFRLDLFFYLFNFSTRLGRMSLNGFWFASTLFFCCCCLFEWNSIYQKQKTLSFK